jgi:hypothetical protein
MREAVKEALKVARATANGERAPPISDEVRKKWDEIARSDTGKNPGGNPPSPRNG